MVKKDKHFGIRLRMVEPEELPENITGQMMPSYRGSQAELEFSRDTPPEHLAHEIGHVASGHSRDNLGPQTADQFVRAELQAEIWSSKQRKVGLDGSSILDIGGILVRDYHETIKAAAGKIARELIHQGLLSEGEYRKYRGAFLTALRLYLEE